MRGCCDFLLPPVVFLSFQFFFQTLFLPMIGPMTGQSIQLDASLSDCCSLIVALEKDVTKCIQSKLEPVGEHHQV